MEQVALEAQRREQVGKGPARRLRQNDLVPGVAYGLNRENIAITVPRDKLAATLRTEQGLNVLLDLRIAGVEAEADTAAIIKEIQRHPVTRAPLSVDFQWISLTQAITVTVPIRIEGESPGVTEGGAVDQIMHEIQVQCLPTNIPDYFVADITGLEINDTVHVEALDAPAGVEILADPSDALVSIAPPITDEDLETRVDEELLEGLEELPLEEELELEEGEEAPAEGEAAEEGAEEEESE